jgi:hypothetical protein
MSVNFIDGDTTPEAARVQLEVFRGMPPGKRLELAIQMSEDLRHVVLAGVRQRHPEYSEEENRLAAIRLTLGDELFRRVYPGVDVEV